MGYMMYKYSTIQLEEIAGFLSISERINFEATSNGDEM